MFALFYAMMLASAFIQSAMQSVTRFSLPFEKFGNELVNYYLEYFHETLMLSDCAKECLYVKRCKSFHYHKLNRQCSLNMIHGSESTWTKDTNYIFSHRMDWPKAIAGTCADEPCSEKEKCIPSRPPLCTPYCGHVPDVRNGYYLANCATFMCVRTYRCEDGFLTTSPHMDVTCQADGNWSPVNFQCISNCGAPPNITNAIVDPGLETENAIRSYTCEPSFTPSGSTLISCQSNSTWTTPQFNCTT